MLRLDENAWAARADWNNHQHGGDAACCVSTMKLLIRR